MLENLWHETDEDIDKVHAFFGGVRCWLKHGETNCGKLYNDPIHQVVHELCKHNFVCEFCGEELDNN